jgi:hypothetical protein
VQIINKLLKNQVFIHLLKSADPSTTQLVIVREKQALLNNLHTYTMYAITVQAYNLAGEGPISAAVYNRTKEGSMC